MFFSGAEKDPPIPVIEYKDSKLSKDQKMRALVLREIVETEHNYVKALGTCIANFLLPLREKAKDGRWVASPEEIARIFSTIEVIHQFNKQFSKQLNERMAQWPNISTFGDIFLQMVHSRFS